MSARLSLRVGCSRCAFWQLRCRSVPAERQVDFEPGADLAKRLADAQPEACVDDHGVRYDAHDVRISWVPLEVGA